MKNTGIVRKVDELGRIVIPKELRKVLNFTAGDDIEIYINEDSVILKKIFIMDSLKNMVDNLVCSVRDLVDCELYISDREKIITNGELLDLKLPNKLLTFLNERKNYISSNEETLKFNNKEVTGYFYINPIIQNSDANGLVIIYKKSNITNQDIFFSDVLKNIIENK